jgi:hypothetical protein
MIDQTDSSIIIAEIDSVDEDRSDWYYHKNGIEWIHNKYMLCWIL